MSWQTASGPPGVLDDQARAAAAGCLRLSAWLGRVGLDSAWRFRDGEGRAFALAQVLLDGGGIQAEVGFEAEDLALAAGDDQALGELARQAIAAWRRQSVPGAGDT